MEEVKQERKFRSVVNRIVALPMLVMGALIIITFVAGIFIVHGLERQIRQSNLGSVQMLQKQISYQQEQMDRSVWDFFDSNDENRILCVQTAESSHSKYILAEMNVKSWMSDNIKMQQQIQGMMIYYENLDLFLFQGANDFEFHQYMKQVTESDQGLYNNWSIVEVNGKYYMLNIYKYGKVRVAAWMSERDLIKNLKLNDDTSMGVIYFFDREINNTLSDKAANDVIKENQGKKESLTINSVAYNNYTAGNRPHYINVGILIPKSAILREMPVLIWILLALFVATLICVPLIILWLQKKIAQPIKAMDDAMVEIGEGNVDYRIDFDGDGKVYDEIDRLMQRFNETMDELNELEFNLYKLKIKEQQTELRYISQQIRPHFILNALNVIYTYDIEDFDLVKKMVLYLTDYFRYIVNLKVDWVDLDKEMHHVENYLNIQKERYLDFFEYKIEWEAATAKVQIPPIIIQTFVENSIKYALKGREKLYIYVSASIEGACLKLLIKDTGKGFTEEALSKICAFVDTREHQEGLGVGIENAIERMDILYKEKIDIRFHNAVSGGAAVEIYLPMTPVGDEELDV